MNIGDFLENTQKIGKRPVVTSQSKSLQVAPERPLQTSVEGTQQHQITIGSLIDPSYKSSTNSNFFSTANSSLEGLGLRIIMIGIFSVTIIFLNHLITVSQRNAYRNNTASYYPTPSPMVQKVENKRNSETPVMSSDDGAMYIDPTTHSQQDLKIVEEVFGPKVNIMDCGNSKQSTQTKGSVACYGMWDYGDEFGSDSYMCESGSKTGCTVRTTACSSGIAVATEYLSNSQLRSSSGIAIEVAANLNTKVEAVQQQIAGLWVYRCN